MPTLRTERLTLRPLRADDFDEWAAVRQRCGEWLTKWEPQLPDGVDDPSYDRDAFDARCAARDRERQLGTGFAFGIWCGKRFRGEANLTQVLHGVFSSGSLGYWIDREVAGQGFTGEAVVAVFGFAFGELGLHRVQISIIPRNHASLRVVEKLGLRQEGTTRDYLKINGTWEDHVHFSITADEWQHRSLELRSLRSAR